MIVIFVALSSEDQDHLYDSTPAVGNDQKVTKRTTARQGEGLEERYQGQEQNKRERRNGRWDTNVLPRPPTDHQQRQQSLNPGSGGNGSIVDTGRL